jgi:hypothetical protein
MKIVEWLITIVLWVVGICSLVFFGILIGGYKARKGSTNDKK